MLLLAFLLAGLEFSTRATPNVRASSRVLVSWMSQLKKRQKNSYTTETLSTSSSIFVFYPRGVVGHLCLTLSASHCFLDFGEAVGFHPFFASYFVLHNNYIRILAIHRYKSSWRCFYMLMLYSCLTTQVVQPTNSQCSNNLRPN